MPAVKGVRAKSPGKKTKAQLEKEKTEQELVDRLTAAGFDPDAMAQALAPEIEIDQEFVDSMIAAGIDADLIAKALALKKTSKQVAWTTKLQDSVNSWTEGSRLVWLVYALDLASNAWTAYSYPAFGMAMLFVYLEISGLILLFKFDKESKKRPVVVVFAILLIMFAKYGLSTVKYYETEDSFKNAVMATKAHQVLKVCNLAVKAELESVKPVKKSLVETFGTLLKY